METEETRLSNPTVLDVVEHTEEQVEAVEEQVEAVEEQIKQVAETVETVAYVTAEKLAQVVARIEVLEDEVATLSVRTCEPEPEPEPKVETDTIDDKSEVSELPKSNPIKSKRYRRL